LDAEGVAPHLRELVDADGVWRALGHPTSIDKVAANGNLASNIGDSDRLIRSID
jgi:hypothetical protein